MSQFDALMGRLDAALKTPRGVSRSAAIAGVRADALALIASGDGASVYALVAEMAISAESLGYYRLPRPSVAATEDCPKCGGEGVFCWGGGCGDCYDCRGSGKVTPRQAEFRRAHVPPVLVRERQAEASGITPFGAAPAASTSPEVDDDPIPF